MHRFISNVLIALFLIAGQGCYQTVVQTAAQGGPPTYSDRQWFTIGGLVGLSGPAGQECGTQGLAYAESEMSGMDILINIGLTLGGAAVGAAVCGEDVDGNVDPICVNAFAGITPFLKKKHILK